MFQDAFDWEMWGLVDYPLIIKKPMHLRLVMSNVESNVYENAYQAAADMRLIFANAMTYNDISSGIYATARAIAEDWEANWTMTPAGAKDEMGPAFLKKFPVPRPQIPRTPEEQQSDDPAVLLVEQHFEKLSVLTTAMTTLDYANDFVAYVNEAITAFHAVEVSKRRLKAAGFVQISELDAWDLQPGGKYFFARNDTTVIAFAIGKDVTPDNISYTVLGAHTDSPCLKVFSTVLCPQSI